MNLVKSVVICDYDDNNRAPSKKHEAIIAQPTTQRRRANSDIFPVKHLSTARVMQALIKRTVGENCTFFTQENGVLRVTNSETRIRTLIPATVTSYQDEEHCTKDRQHGHPAWLLSGRSKG